MLQSKFPDIDPYNYISFHCLKNWAIMDHKIVTEQIYIHDKIMIVDDLVAIIGSANLNDRSMMGHRDSEVIFPNEIHFIDYIIFIILDCNKN